MNSGIDDEKYYRQRSSTGLAFRWMAPESFNGRRFTAKSDMWSVGVVIFQLLTGQHLPYAEVRDPMDVIAGLIDGSLDLRSSLPPFSGLWSPLLDLARACLDRDPGRRPTALNACAFLGGMASPFAASATGLVLPITPVSASASSSTVFLPRNHSTAIMAEVERISITDADDVTGVLTKMRMNVELVDLQQRGCWALGKFAENDANRVRR
jgi:serine/threonine protein kinase